MILLKATRVVQTYKSCVGLLYLPTRQITPGELIRPHTGTWLLKCSKLPLALVHDTLAPC